MKWLTAALLALAAVLAALLVYRNFALQALSGGTNLDMPVKVPPLPLLNDRGQATTLADSGGRMRLIFFGYVHCPDVCPTTLASLKNTYSTLSAEQKGKLTVQFVTVDPAQDTPQLVREYLDRFDPAFTGLTGKSAAIDEAAKALYVANVNPPAPTDHASMDHASMDHGSHGATPSNTDDQGVSAATAARIHGDEVRVITPAGEFVRVYNNQEALDGTLKHDLPELIRQYGR